MWSTWCWVTAWLCSSERAPNQVRAIAELKLESLKTWIGTQRAVTVDVCGLFVYLGTDQAFRDDQEDEPPRPQDPPDGQPIGMDWWGRAERGCDWR
jgi:hypothetical protein